MNALETINAIRDYIKNTEHWLTDEFVNPRALSNISASIQHYAKKLAELEAERIQDLQNNGPKISGELCDITITLLRDGKEKFIPFGEYSVDIKCTNEEDTLKEFKVDGPPDTDGYTYFIYARPSDYGQVAFAIWVSKEEATTLKKDLKELYDDLY